MSVKAGLTFLCLTCLSVVVRADGISSCDILVSRENVGVERWRMPKDDAGAWRRIGFFADSKSVPGGLRCTGIAVDGTGSVFVGDTTEGGRIVVLTADGSFDRVFVRTGFRPDNLCLSPDGKWLYVSSLESGIYRYGTSSGEGGLVIATATQPRCVKFGPDGFLYAGCRGDGAVRVWDVSGRQAVEKGVIKVSCCAGAFEFARKDGTLLIVPGARMDFVDLRKGTVSTLATEGGLTVPLGAVSAGGKTFVGDFRAGKIYRIDGRGVKEVASGIGNLCAMAALPGAAGGRRFSGLAKDLVLRTPTLRPEQDFARMGFNNPEAIVWAKAGCSCDWLRVVDFDGDGTDDIVLSCGAGDAPWGDAYFFRRPVSGGKPVLDPVFDVPKRVAPKDVPSKFPPCLSSTGGALPRIHYTDGVKRPNFFQGRCSQGGDVNLRDLDGDGIVDLILRAGDRDMGSWQDRFDERGNWKDVQLRSFVYVCKGLGGNRYGDPRMLYLENELPLETYGGWSTLVEDWDHDGDFDLILLDFMDTIAYFENVGTKTAPQFTAGRFVRDGEGRRIHGDLCLPKAVSCDWDGDGEMDILMTEEDSRLAWCRNTGRIKDGMPVFEQPHYFRQKAGELNFGALCCPWAFDWDGDGDEDLIVGNSHGQIAFIENLSGPRVEKPKWAAPVLLKEPDGRPIWLIAGHSGSIQGACEWKWGYMTLSVADWDGDGLPDIMGNTITGEVRWWRNIGTRTSPKLDFARRVEVEWNGAQPELKWGWMKPRLQSNPKDLLTQWRTTPVMYDWNGDGLMDLLMLDTEGYFCLYERARSGGKTIVKAPRRVFLDENGNPLLLRCGFNAGIGCGRRKFCLCDWNGDGKTDLMMNGAANVEVYLQIGHDGKGWRFRPIGDVARLNLATHDPQPSACDFNGDGVPDLLLGAIDGFVYYYRNPRAKGK